MIDLRESELPSGIWSGGVFYALDTDFRTWIAFDFDLRTAGVASPYVFAVDVPQDAEALESLLEFYRSENVTPKPRAGGSGERALDLVLDGDYIVASFQKAYGIDLTDPALRMHWHRFKALLNGLLDDTVLGRAMGYRTYRGGNRKHEDVMRELQEAWRLPDPDEDRQDAELLQWAEEMGL